MSEFANATLKLGDGRIFHGRSFGAQRSVSGEIVFNTAMTGYPESLTDPSYKGQILVVTYPLVGNYGVPELLFENGIATHFESDRLHLAGLVIAGYSGEYSHWAAGKSLGDWLIEHDIPAICDVDTRALTRHIRSKGAMPAGILMDGQDLKLHDPNEDNLVALVSTPEPITYGNGQKRILLIDCGVKNNILRCLLRRDTTVYRVPWDFDPAEGQWDGVLLSNGPGDPKQCGPTIQTIRKLMKHDIPIFGICLGNQLLSLAAGADTYKLPYGHRGHNQGVIMNGTPRCFITSQNHGYAVNPATLEAGWEEWFTNLNDGSNEGIRHKAKPWFSVQFHPEASSGPTDTEFLFDLFLDNIVKGEGL